MAGKTVHYSVCFQVNTSTKNAKGWTYANLFALSKCLILLDISFLKQFHIFRRAVLLINFQPITTGRQGGKIDFRSRHHAI